MKIITLIRVGEKGNANINKIGTTFLEDSFTL